MSLDILSDKETAVKQHIHMLPRRNLVIFTLAVCVECLVDAEFFKCRIPYIRFEILVPAVKLTAVLPCLIDNPRQLCCALYPDSTRQIGSRGVERLYQRLQILSGRLYISSFQRKIKGNYSKSGKEPYGNHRL